MQDKFEPTHEQVLLRDSVRELCRELGTGQRDLDGMRRNWTRLAGLGWLMAGISEAVGGLGGDLHDPAIIAGELAAGLAAEPYLGCGVLAPQVLASLAPTSPSAASLLEAALAGERVFAVAGDVSPRRELADAAQAGSELRLSGMVPVVLGGGFADTYLVAARAAGEFLLLAASGDREGLACRPFRLLDGSPAAEIAFEDAAFTEDDILARGDAAARAYEDAIERATVIAAADLAGAAEAALWQTRDYLKVRRQFGTELASFQALQHRMADMYIGLQLMLSILHHGIAGAGAAAPRAQRMGASACKSLANRRAREITAQAIQLHGGIGVTEELTAGQYFRRVSVVARQFGTWDEHVERLALLLEPDPGLTI